MIFITKDAVKILLSKSRKVVAKTVADAFNIDLITTHVMSVEQSTIRNIMRAFKNEEMVQQYSVKKYRIDLYFPKHKLAVECDENSHDKSIEYDSKREKEIQTILDCKFIRYKPESSDFDICDIINEIYIFIKHK